MEFPITDLLDHDSSVAWITQHFRPHGLNCPKCHATIEQARIFRRTQKSQLVVYRCLRCHTAYNLYSGTILHQTHFTPMQAVLLLRGFCKGETTQELAVELGVSYKTVLEVRHRVQANAARAQPQTPLPDENSETDEMFQNAGEKR